MLIKKGMILKGGGQIHHIDPLDYKSRRTRVRIVYFNQGIKGEYLTKKKYIVKKDPDNPLPDFKDLFKTEIDLSKKDYCELVLRSVFVEYLNIDYNLIHIVNGEGVPQLDSLINNVKHNVVYDKDLTYMTVRLYGFVTAQVCLDNQEIFEDIGNDILHKEVVKHFTIDDKISLCKILVAAKFRRYKYLSEEFRRENSLSKKHKMNKEMG